MNRSVFLLLLVVFCAGVPAYLFSQESEQDYTVSLVTTGPGKEVYLWWGHIALMVENHRTGRSSFYDFGVFSFETENFFLNFLMGRLWYMSYRSPAEANLRRSIREDRTIRVQKLRFAPGKKLELIRELEYRVRPENRSYLYHYYLDNCATRIRDLLNDAYNGQLRDVSVTDDRMTLRLQTRRFTGRNPLVEWVLMYLMGSSIDQEITGWGAMFLPSEVPRYLARVRISAGPDKGLPAIVSDSILHQSGTAEQIPEKPGSGLFFPLLAGLAAALLLIGGRTLKGIPGTAAQIFYRLLLSLAALLGSVLFFLSFFTDHSVTYHNWNLLLLNPLHWLTVFSPYRLKTNESSPWKNFILFAPWIITIDASLLLLIAKIFGVPSQSIGQTVALLLPLAVGIAGPWIKKVLMPLRGRSIVN